MVYSNLSSKLMTYTISITLLFLIACSSGNNGDSVDNSVPPVISTCTEACDKRFRINEAVSSNAIFEDEEGKSPDWIEIVNYGDTNASLENWTITDDVDDPSQWTFPDFTLQAGAYLRIWASDKDRIDNSDNFHTNFKISSGGETLYLYDNEGTLIHQLLVENVTGGNSVGISTQGTDVVYFNTPTPGEVNSTNEFVGISTTKITFSHDGGTVTPQTIVLDGATTPEVIRITLDGSIPTENSMLYTSPIVVEENSVIRAAIFQDNFIPSKVQTRSYFVDNPHDLPIVSLVTEPSNFFDNDTGIYQLGDNANAEPPNYGANFWEDWEKEIHFSFYEPDGSIGVSLDAGVKIFGGWSRSNEQRSLSIFARGRYGEKEIEYPLFPELEYDEFQALVLRNSGNDWLRAVQRDITLTSLMDGSGLEKQAYRSVAVYLNKEYWGMYNLREKVNEHFLASKFDLDADDIDLLGADNEVLEGSSEEYTELTTFLEGNNVISDENYNLVADQIDIENFIIYQIAQIYFANQDWPGNNIKFWKSPETKWRWILYDTEFSSSIYSNSYNRNSLFDALADNGPSWPNPPWSTLLLRRLVENQRFKNQFINRFADELNTRFLAENVNTHIDTIAASISNEIPLQFERWRSYAGGRSWIAELQKLKTFADLRVSYVMNNIKDQFNLADIHTITVENSDTDKGIVQLNSLNIKEALWQGEYFESIPVTLVAKPKDGYQFSSWSGVSNDTSEEIQLELTTDTRIEAIFTQVR